MIEVKDYIESIEDSETSKQLEKEEFKLLKNTILNQFEIWFKLNDSQVF